MWHFFDPHKYPLEIDQTELPQDIPQIDESRFLEIPEEIREQVRQLLTQIHQMKDFLLMSQNHNARIIIGNILSNSRKINIFLTNIDIAYADTKNNKIYIPYHDLNLDEILYDLNHEILHFVDPKSYKPHKLSKRYRELVQKNSNLTDSEKTAYVKEPTEFDAIGSHIATQIRYIFDHSPPEDKTQTIEELKNWLRYGGRLMDIHTNELNRWKTRPTLWRRFQMRIWNLVQELEAKLPKPPIKSAPK